MDFEKLVKLLLDKKLKIATAESCTGGLLAKKITDISGSSAVFDMGIVSYANRIKNEFLGVKNEILETVGAVSSETALAMAEGIRKIAVADIGVGITGIAGPTGGTPGKPVGLVYFAVSYKDETRVEKLLLDGNRDEIRNKTTEIVCREVINRIEE